MTQNFNPFDSIEIRLSQIESLLIDLKHSRPAVQTLFHEPDRFFDLLELCEYLPTKPKPPTVYNLVAERNIPFSKNGKKLVFLKSDIDIWLKSGRTATKAQEREQLRIQAETHLQNIRRK